MVFMHTKKRLLVFISFYLPGFKAGGPIKTIQNMVTQLDGDLDFCIVTRDRDLGDTEAYSSIKPVYLWIKIRLLHGRNFHLA